MPPKKAESAEIHHQFTTGEEISKVFWSLPKEEGIEFIMSLSNKEFKLYDDYVDEEVAKTLKETDKIIEWGEKKIKEFDDFCKETDKFVSAFK